MMPRKNSLVPILLLAGLLWVSCGCVGPKRPVEPVFKGEEPPTARSAEPRAVKRRPPVEVLPESAEGGPFAHPADIDEAMLARLLQSVYFRWRSSLTWSNPERLMSDKEATLLAAQAAGLLRRLRPDQVVSFRLATKQGETRGELFVKNGYFNIRLRTVRNHPFLRKGPKANTHQWKLEPQEGQGFYPSTAQLLGAPETTDWLVVRLRDLAPGDGEKGGGAAETRPPPPPKEPFTERLNVFP